ncbi:MAG: hypothetical protein AAB728_06135, partial [Patescibacteria group bacterium]
GETLRGGRCTGGSARNCSDGNACTNDSCAENQDVCLFINNANSCDDGNPNTVDDRCATGQCRGVAASAPGSSAASSTAAAGSNLAVCNGQEVDLNTSVVNCGSCGKVCRDLPHAAQNCRAGSCAFSACLQGWRNLDGNNANGCEGAPAGSNLAVCNGQEVDLNTSVVNCGSCGKVCRDLPHAAQNCRAGSCAFSACLQGWRNLDGNNANGCEAPPQ